MKTAQFRIYRKTNGAASDMLDIPSHNRFDKYYFRFMADAGTLESAIIALKTLSDSDSDALLPNPVNARHLDGHRYSIWTPMGAGEMDDDSNTFSRFQWRTILDGAEIYHIGPYAGTVQVKLIFGNGEEQDSEWDRAYSDDELLQSIPLCRRGVAAISIAGGPVTKVTI